jgi:N-acetylglucosamine-6-phosphate deacetylase
MIPGFVDLQINGWGGVDFSSPSLTEEECNTAFDQIGECMVEGMLVQHTTHTPAASMATAQHPAWTAPTHSCMPCGPPSSSF